MNQKPLSSPGILASPAQHKLDDPGDPVTRKLTVSVASVFTGFPLSRE
jgi:hypothetical protein